MMVSNNYVTNVDAAVDVLILVNDIEDLSVYTVL